MIEQLSRHYNCRILAEKDIPSILSLYESNPLYFQHCPPAPNLESVKEDMARLPEGKAKVDKFYVGILVTHMDHPILFLFSARKLVLLDFPT